MPFYKSIKQIRSAVKNDLNQLSKVTEDVLKALDSRGKALNAVSFLDKEFSNFQAQELKKDKPDLPLYGVPLAHKELFGRVKINDGAWPNEGGSESLKGELAKQTASVIHSLDQAGAVDCGRLVSVEFGLGVTGHNEYSGTPKNPWNENYVCGGSSSGSSSIVASGIVPAALGSDTGGSVRLPAAACGLVGIKPTQGLISRNGVFPLSETLDTVGPLARSVEDAAEILQIIAGYDPVDQLSIDIEIPDFKFGMDNGISGLKIGLPEKYFLRGSDAEMSDFTFSSFRISEKLGAKCCDIVIPDIESTNELNMLLISTEAAKLHKETVISKHKFLNEQTLMRILPGMFTKDSDLQKLKQFRIDYISRILSEVFTKVDVIMTPVWPVSLPKIDESDVGANPEANHLVKRVGHNTRPINFLGLPSICLPTGFDKNGLPVSVQLIGKPFSEKTLIRVARTLEREYCFWDNKPDE